MVNVTVQKYDTQGLCVGCGAARDAKFKRCGACRQKARERQAQIKAESPGIVKKWQDTANANRRRHFKQLGLCSCGKNVPAPGKKRCLACLQYHSRASGEYQKRYPEKAVDYRRRLKHDVLFKYGNICDCCGEHRHEFLAIDHKNQDGNLERKRLLSKGGHKCGSFKWYLKLKREPKRDDLRVLCHNCNMAIAFYGVCPHQLERESQHERWENGEECEGEWA